MPPILFSDHPRKPGSRLDCLSKFSEEWLSQLDKENVKGLSMFLVFQLVQHFRFTWTNAETCAAQAVGKGERSVRRWRSVLIKHRGQFPSSKQGRYRRTGVLWKNEELNQKATSFVRENANVKGKPKTCSGETRGRKS